MNAAPWLLIDGDLVPTGGMDIANLRLAEYLAESTTLHLVTHRADAALLRHPNVSAKIVPRPFGAHFLGGFALDWSGQRAARQLSSSNRLNVVVNGGNCLAPANINWVHYVHAAYAPRSNSIGWRNLKNYLHRRHALRTERKAIQSAELIICNSKLTANHVRDHFQVPHSRLKVIYYGIDAERFQIPSSEVKATLRKSLGWRPQRLKILFVGALGDRRKGFDTVATAWAELCHRHEWNCDLVVVGTGVEKETWQGRFKSLGCNHLVEFLGFRRDVPDLMRAADALIAPTRYEAYGLGVHEAICCGLPAFVSRNSGVAERFPDSVANALLINDPNDSNELVGKLLNWHGHFHLWPDAIKPFADSLRSRSWQDMAKEFVEHVQANSQELDS
jgi:glycosyltransferase involved in cell wall biosynthesis